MTSVRVVVRAPASAEHDFFRIPVPAFRDQAPGQWSPRRRCTISQRCRRVTLEAEATIKSRGRTSSQGTISDATSVAPAAIFAARAAEFYGVLRLTRAAERPGCSGGHPEKCRSCGARIRRAQLHDTTAAERRKTAGVCRVFILRRSREHRPVLHAFRWHAGDRLSVVTKEPVCGGTESIGELPGLEPAALHCGHQLSEYSRRFTRPTRTEDHRCRHRTTRRRGALAPEFQCGGGLKWTLPIGCGA